MSLPITNITDLRTEITRLKLLNAQQRQAIVPRFSSPSAVFSTIYSAFSGKPGVEGEHKEKGFFEQDIVGLLSRIVLPFTLNKTIFRNSNFIVKTLVGLASQKASHFISEDTVTGIWGKIKSLLPHSYKPKPVLKRREPKTFPAEIPTS